jgi:hypothetical protein
MTGFYRSYFMAGPNKNQYAIKPNTAGAEGAIKRYGQGQPFIGHALAAEHEATEAIKRPGGLDDLLEQNAARLQAISTLYYEAMTYQASQGDLEKFDQYAARYGWITSKTILALAEVKKNQKAGGGKLAQVLLDYQDAAKTHQDAPGEALEGEGIENDPQEATDESSSE